MPSTGHTSAAHSYRHPLKRTTTVVFVLAAAAAVTGYASRASAGEKTRYCDARIRVELKPRAHFSMAYTDIDLFSAKGKDFNANDARREARERARSCARKVWDVRWSNHPYGHGKPGKCTTGSWVYNFDTTNIKCKIYDAVCALKSWQGRGAGVTDYAVVWTRITGGSYACDGAELHEGNYRVPVCSPAARANECGS